MKANHSSTCVLQINYEVRSQSVARLHTTTISRNSHENRLLRDLALSTAFRRPSHVVCSLFDRRIQNSYPEMPDLKTCCLVLSKSTCCCELSMELEYSSFCCVKRHVPSRTDSKSLHVWM
jgi:hypothetical protein